jgi:hypothetical protein
MNPKTETMNREKAEEMAVSIFVWLTGREELLSRFLALSGLTATGLRQASSDPGFLGGIVDFVMAHEPTLMEFCKDSGFRPESVAASHHALNGGEADPWM